LLLETTQWGGRRVSFTHILISHKNMVAAGKTPLHHSTYHLTRRAISSLQVGKLKENKSELDFKLWRTQKSDE